MYRLSRREQAILIGFLLVVLVASGIYMYGRPGLSANIPLPKTDAQYREASSQTQNISPAGTGSAGSQSEVPTKSAVPNSVTEMKVDVKGAVHLPGVYTLPVGSRVADALQAAGGANDQADLQTVNLAQKLVDGGMLVIPVKGEKEAGASTASSVQRKVNINTATAAELDAVNGIGSTRANDIVAFRERQGPFQSVDDLLKVKGFGPKLLESLREQITVN
ncbi:ComEA family DNA-binding protein [Effusibacillus dendaii]|uniref:Helix-hairpin-helix DNA-binding motif class 1 domain-containing protein n=1 Tax=Effusibacillus dendaii TaxID=2743772 RepID=A0A7I8DKX7_9BACL|nr:ComEA family DNA-binding protein [Effusibacillus dendaii]BCJ88581.1 hypothetical protein skT53_35660 [Effusibacillus dendaii]